MLIGLESHKSNLGLVWCAKYWVQAQFGVTSSRNHFQNELSLISFWAWFLLEVTPDWAGTKYFAHHTNPKLDLLDSSPICTWTKDPVFWVYCHTACGGRRRTHCSVQSTKHKNRDLTRFKWKVIKRLLTPTKFWLYHTKSVVPPKNWTPWGLFVTMTVSFWLVRIHANKSYVKKTKKSVHQMKDTIVFTFVDDVWLSFPNKSGLAQTPHSIAFLN